ncbi:MAG: SagB/ThcOx family dehydrogenase [Planctomycetes bacterium]|nr:SagB/ThcOx family dehydrogenase [Planctomycetota bacterium]
MLTTEGVFHFIPRGHKLQQISKDDARKALYSAALEQEAVRDAPAVFLIAADYRRTSRKYGERAERYVHMEAGHAAQNLLLQVEALGLGGVPIGAFDDQAAHRALALPSELAVLYLLPVGHPAREP